MTTNKLAALLEARLYDCKTMFEAANVRVDVLNAQYHAGEIAAINYALALVRP